MGEVKFGYAALWQYIKSYLITKNVKSCVILNKQTSEIPSRAAHFATPAVK